MHSQRAKSAMDTGLTCFERQVPVESVFRLGLPIAQALGEAGVGGPVIQQLMVGSVVAECVSCRLRVSGAELTEAALGLSAGAALTDKVERLRLGYCARRTCPSRYYLFKFADQSAVDWAAVWSRAQELASVAEEKKPRNSFPPEKLFALVARCFENPIKYALPLAVVVLIALVWFLRSGCRVPGISPKPRVFIVAPQPDQLSPSKTNATRSFITR